MRNFTKTVQRVARWSLFAAFCLTLENGYAQAFALSNPLPAQQPQQGSPQILLRTALLDLMERQQIDIIFDESLLTDMRIPERTARSDKSAETILANILESTGLYYRKIRRNTYLILKKTNSPRKMGNDAAPEPKTLPATNHGNGSASRPPDSAFGIASPVIVPDYTVAGRVNDEKGAGLPGVSVLVKGTQIGTTTDQDGTYNLAVPNQNAVLVFSFVGYLAQEVRVGTQTRIEVNLVVDTKSLNEVVVVGYGTQKKVNMTGAVATIEPKDIEDRPVASVAEALQGQVAGLNVVRTGGQPGNQAINFRIRGTSTFTSNPVLTLIDGVPSSLDRINPSDIESISILKDAASAAIYGSRATGGVILVTTKSGKSGKPRVSLSSSWGIQQPTRFPEKVSALDHALLSNEARANDGGGPKFTNSDIQRFSSPDWVDHDWDGYMFRNAILANQNLSISGGSETHDYYLSLGYLKQDGIILNTGYERLNLQLNQNIRVSDKFKLSIKAGYVPSTRTAPGGGNLNNLLSFVGSQPKTDAIRTSDGKWLQNSTNTGGGNPIATASEDGGQQLLKSSRVQGNFTLDYEILPQLKLTGIYGIARTQSRQRDYRKKITLYRQDDPEQIASQSVDNYLDVNNFSETQQNVNLLLNYGKTLNNHTFSILGGAVAEWYESGNDLISTRDFLTDNIYTVSAGSSDPTLWNIEGDAADWALASAISRATYSYMDKYLLEGSFRYDGSSRFSEGLRWGFFPSASFGWVVSQENFLKTNNVLTFLKLRGSWGRVGNQNVGFYPFANTLAQTTYYFNGAPRRGVTTAGAPNPLLTWETKESVNIGLDGSLFRNMIEFSLDVFKERTSDILLKLPLPTTFGQSEPVQNVGSIANKGWELDLRHRNSVGAFNYGVSFQVSNSTNKVLDMGGVSPRISGNTITEEGRPLDEWFGWRSVGFFQSDSEVKEASFQNPRTSPGDIRYEENGGNPATITSDDRVRLGRSDPRLPYGVRVNLSYKNFSIAAFGQGVMKHVVWSNGWTANNFDRENSTLRTYHLDRWTPETPNGYFPKTRMGSGAARSGINDSFSSFWLEDASYFRLKNIELSYNIPAKVLSRIKLNGARIMVNAENLLTITDYLGYDPETPTGTGSRMVETRYPLAKVFNFGINLNF